MIAQVKKIPETVGGLGDFLYCVTEVPDPFVSFIAK